MVSFEQIQVFFRELRCSDIDVNSYKVHSGDNYKYINYSIDDVFTVGHIIDALNAANISPNDVCLCGSAKDKFVMELSFHNVDFSTFNK